MNLRYLLSSFCAVFVINLQAQIIGPGGSFLPVKTFDIYPIADSEVEINGVNGGTKNIVPYDFYAVLNCEVEHTLDSVFYAESDSITLTIESDMPCYVIFYGKRWYNGLDGDFHVIPVSTYSSSLQKYKETVTVHDIDWGLNRIFATRKKSILKKKVQTVGPRDPISLSTASTPDLLAANAISTGGSSCSISIFDYETGRTSHIEGNVNRNMLMLSGTGGVMEYGYTYYDAQFPNEAYTIFTAQSTTDVDMFLMDSNYNVIAHCNDYIAQSTHDWGTEARIDMDENSAPNAIILLPYRPYIEQEKEYEFYEDEYVFQGDNPDGQTNLYLGCKFYDYTYDDGQLFFPLLTLADAIESDYYRVNGQGFSSGFNCFSWVMGSYSYYFHKNYHPSTVSSLISSYESEGYTTVGATEANSEIDIWEYNGHCTHASIRSGTNGYSYGYAWESKDGLYGGRFMHPRYALTNDNPDFPEAYGHVAAYMIKDPNYVDTEIVYENISFTNDELNEIGQSLAASDIDTDEYEELYSSIIDDIRKSHISNPSLLYILVDSYRDFVDGYGASKATQYWLMEKLSQGDILASYMILDIQRLNEDEDSVQKVQSAFASSNANQRIIRNDISNAVLYAKSLLGNATLSETEMGKSLSYSNNSHMMDIRAAERQMSINLNLERTSNVSLIIARHDGTGAMILVDQKTLDASSHQFNARVATPGIYSVTLLLNGQIYTQKINIQ